MTSKNFIKVVILVATMLYVPYQIWAFLFSCSFGGNQNVCQTFAFTGLVVIFIAIMALISYVSYRLIKHVLKRGTAKITDPQPTKTHTKVHIFPLVLASIVVLSVVFVVVYGWLTGR